MSPIFSKDIAKSLANYLQESTYTRKVLLVDENTEKYCLPLIKESAKDTTVIRIKSGEMHKTIATCIEIWEQMTEAGLDRNSLMINLGGGVIGDMGGFCASTYKRGIDFINIPTTLLSQVDASVGGKLGVDFQGLKNHIGLFTNPKAIIVCADFLNTLPQREIKSGFAEIIKHAIISDQLHWSNINGRLIEDIDLDSIVKHSVKIKEAVVKEDPLEQGKRKILNFGHTIGHAVESSLLNSDNHLLHGEAVALGMICESYIAFKKGLINKAELDQITQTINLNYKKVEITNDLMKSALELVNQDKKNKEGKILLALPKGIGRAVWDVETDTIELKEAMVNYSKL